MTRQPDNGGSQTNQSKSDQSPKSRLPLIVLMVLCLLGAGLYVINGGLGNNAGQTIDQVSMDALSEKAERIENAARGDVAAMAALERPVTMPDHQFVAPDGSAKSLDDFKGKVLLVNLWATWCAPCREEMPALSELQTARKGETFEVITINIDRGGRDKPENFLKDIGVENLPLYQDNSMGVFNALKKEGLAFGLPVTFLMDEAGYILGSMNGPAHWSSPDALAYIDAAIATQAIK